MKLEYLYHNKNNLKYALKAFSIFELAIILISVVMHIYFEKNVDYSFIVMFTIGIIVIFGFANVIFLIIITLTNNYKRKQFMYIKNNGEYFEGVIIGANYHFEGFGRYRWASKASGDIYVSVDNNIYTITDVDYNNEFKILEQKIKDTFYINRQQISDLKQHFRDNGTLYKIQTEKLKIGIYVLDNKAIADFDSIQVN